VNRKTAIIIGGGPAGLTAAFELLERTDVIPIVIEKSDQLGGISKTVNYKGNRIDIGGHRFFSKSDRVMNWWLERLPMESAGGARQRLRYHQQERVVAPGTVSDPRDRDDVMLVRQRRSRIYFLRKFFDYPITLSTSTVRNLGLWRTMLIGLSYMWSCVFPIRNESNLEEFFINRFGRRLYRTFFKAYTEKVWGLPCHQISAEWGAQRIKGLSVRKALAHAFSSLVRPRKTADLAQKDTETSLIDQFLYPKFGPGQMWEAVGDEIRQRGGRILFGRRVEAIHAKGSRIDMVETVDSTGRRSVFEADYVFSTMPIRELIAGLRPEPPKNVREVSTGLVYRDFMTVGLLVRDLKIKENTDVGRRFVRDNWIYIQEPDVLVGRLQIFNNWSPSMVADPGTVWLGLEYFCNEGDELWKRSDREMIELAKAELHQIGIVDSSDFLDATVLRVEKTYPAYFGTYARFDEIRSFIDEFENLFLIGRNGMHRYNNQDHSMLTAMVAVDNIVAGRTDKENIWSVNTEQDYHEEKAAEDSKPEPVAKAVAQ
jgi:protoporphyrinogen oxidase